MAVATGKPYLLLAMTMAVLTQPRDTGAITAFCAVLETAFDSYNCECREALGSDGSPTLNVVLDCSNLGLSSVPSPASTLSIVLHEFILANNSITALDDNSFTGLKIRALDLSGNSITSIAHNAFLPIANDLRELKLDGDRSQGPPKPAFDDLSDLEVLTLGDYNVQVLGDFNHHYFLGMPNLKHLTIREWSILAMEPNAFRGPTDLQSLTIQREIGLAGLPVSVLKHNSLVNLKRLQISATAMQEITQDAFDRLTKLEELDLSDNHISKITLDSLKGLGPSLKKLSFASNFLKSDPDTSDLSGLRNLPNLEELDLSRNEAITEIPDLSQLNPGEQTSLKIFLGNNRIKSVSPSAFSATARRVHTLDLSDNSIVTMDPNAFSGMTHLQVLRLSQQTSPTSSRALPSSLTQSADSLTHLFLDGVQLDTQALWAVLPQLANLKVLDLRSTELSELQNLAFQKMTGLEELYLDGNSLTSLDQDDLTGPGQTLKKLYLSNNPLRRISNCALAHYKNFPITLSLQSAPLQCDCQLGWLHKSATQGTIEFLDGHAPTCANLNNQLLMDKSYSLICADNTYSDPPCKTPITPDPTTTPGLPTLTLEVIKTTSSSITLSWALSHTRDIISFAVRVTNNYADSEFSRYDIAPRVFQLEAKPLLPDTQHQVCLIANFQTINSVTKCTLVRTDKGSGPSGQTGGSDSNNTGIIIGAVVGAILLLVVLAAIFYLVVIRRQPKTDPSSTAGPIQLRNFTKSELPAMTDDSRTLSRPKRQSDHHDGMQVVAISDGQVHDDRHASNGSASVGRATMLNSNGPYKLMSGGASSIAGTSATGSTSDGQSLYENDRGLLPKTPPYHDHGLRGPRQPGYYNEAFETDKYDEIEMQRESQL